MRSFIRSDNIGCEFVVAVGCLFFLLPGCLFGSVVAIAVGGGPGGANDRA
jgi:hypothetical protein